MAMSRLRESKSVPQNNFGNTMPFGALHAHHAPIHSFRVSWRDKRGLAPVFLGNRYRYHCSRSPQFCTTRHNRHENRAASTRNHTIPGTEKQRPRNRQQMLLLSPSHQEYGIRSITPKGKRD